MPMIRGMSSLARIGGLLLALPLAAAGQAGRDESVISQEPESAKGYTAPLYFTNAQKRFSIQLPAGWIPMPAGLAENLSTPSPAGDPVGTSIFGFELAANTNTLSSPYVTVQVRPAGRIADGFIRMLRNPEVCRRAVLDLVKNDGLTETNISRVSFETNRHRLAFCATRTDANGIPLRLWQSITFTEQGSINMACLADNSVPVDWDDTYTRVLDSLNIHTSLAYRPQTNVARAEGARFRAGSTLLLPGAMVLLGLGRLVSRRFSDDIRSDEI